MLWMFFVYNFINVYFSTQNILH
uniref:Uncharacterized protein n=1 Tax=Heterorhabditis bacteriophora TaxID=37862 RepID=A0A1I7WHI0_HETBA